MFDFGTSLNTKTVFSLLIPLLLYAVATAVFQDAIISPSFADLEYREARKDAERCVSAINREIHHLQAITNDWASFNDTYEFIYDRNEDYIRNNLIESTFINLNLNFIYFYNDDGKLIWGKTVEYENGTEREIEIFDSADDSLLQNLLLEPGGAGDIPGGRAGVLLTARGPLIVSSEPVLTSRCERPHAGNAPFRPAAVRRKPEPPLVPDDDSL